MGVGTKAWKSFSIGAGRDFDDRSRYDNDDQYIEKCTDIMHKQMYLLHGTPQRSTKR